MNDVGAAPSFSEGPPTDRLLDEARRDPHPQPSVPSSPKLNGDGHKTPGSPHYSANDGVASPKADSEAETIIQSGREELSPEKKRKVVQHTVDEVDEERDNGDMDAADISSDDRKARKRKRLETGSRDDSPQIDVPSRVSSRGSSKQSSPSRGLKRKKTEEPGIESQSRGPSRSSSEGPHVPKTADTKTAVSNDGITAGESAARPKGDDNQHTPESSHNNEPETSNKNNNSINNNNISYSHHRSNDRSTSPVSRSHRRSVSSTLYSSTRPQKKKRAPPPLLTDHLRHRSEDRESVSSPSGSPAPHVKSGRHASGDYSSTPGPKHPMVGRRRDQSGRTRLARACAAQEVDAAKTYHTEQPEDLNIPDNAGNTPLQIASLLGCVELVKYLLDAGCDINAKNIDKDTPLIDAVENCHLEVVKLLLEAGASPRVCNAQGDLPLDLVPSDHEDCEEMRRIIKRAEKIKETGAKANTDNPPRKSEELSAARDTHDTAAASPRDSTPAISVKSPPPLAVTGRRKTVRSEATRNDLLWTSATPENLRDFAAKGDMEGVATILNVLGKADSESLIAAVKGGHDEVLGLLLGMGDPDPDPNPSPNHKPGYGTPMLAGIGRGNLQVINLLLDQRGFDPTRLNHLGRTYYEVSQERKGENWDREFQLLKDAYDNYSKTSESRKPDTRSPRRARDKNRDTRIKRRESASPESVSHKRTMKDSSMSSLSKEGRVAKEKKKRDGMEHPKEKPNRGPHRKDGLQVAGASDQDASRRQSRAHLEGKSHDGNSSPTHGEENVKRRRLIPGRPPPHHAARRGSHISSDSHSSRDEGIKAKADESGNESKVNRASSPLKRPRRRSGTPESGQGNRRQSRQSDSHGQQFKRRRVQSDEDIPRSSPENVKTKEPRRQSENSQPHSFDANPSRETRGSSRHISAEPEDAGPVSSTRNEAGSPAAKKEPKEPELAAHPSEATRAANEAEAKKVADAKEAEERRLAAEAERERQEREAREAEEAKEAAERAARIARERAEEEERKRKEAEQRRARQAEEEHQKRLEQERLRQARLRREQEEQEQRRREALPNRLWTAAELIGSNHPRARSQEWLRRFFPLVTVTTKQINPSCEPEVEEDRWVPNYLVAPLLATNDLQLSQYTSWEKRVATPTQRQNLWNVTRNILTQNDILNPLLATPEDAWARNKATRPKFFAMEHVFFVKLSDFMDLVPHIPHLQDLKFNCLKVHVDPEPVDGDSNQEAQHPSRPGTSANGNHVANPVPNGTASTNEHSPSE